MIHHNRLPHVLPCLCEIVWLFCESCAVYFVLLVMIGSPMLWEQQTPQTHIVIEVFIFEMVEKSNPVSFRSLLLVHTPLLPSFFNPPCIFHSSSFPTSPLTCYFRLYKCIYLTVLYCIFLCLSSDPTESPMNSAKSESTCAC